MIVREWIGRVQRFVLRLTEWGARREHLRLLRIRARRERIRRQIETDRLINDDLEEYMGL